MWLSTNQKYIKSHLSVNHACKCYLSVNHTNGLSSICQLYAQLLWYYNQLHVFPQRNTFKMLALCPVALLFVAQRYCFAASDYPLR